MNARGWSWYSIMVMLLAAISILNSLDGSNHGDNHDCS
jgi:hypothetical protein